MKTTCSLFSWGSPAFPSTGDNVGKWPITVHTATPSPCYIWLLDSRPDYHSGLNTPSVLPSHLRWQRTTENVVYESLANVFLTQGGEFTFKGALMATQLATHHLPCFLPGNQRAQLHSLAVKSPILRELKWTPTLPDGTNISLQRPPTCFESVALGSKISTQRPFHDAVCMFITTIRRQRLLRGKISLPQRWASW